MEKFYFKGTQAACLAHYASSTFNEDPRMGLALFTGTTVHPTVHRWLRGTAVPIGENAIGVRYYLELLGYEISENPRDPVLQEIGRMVAYDIATVEDLCKEVGAVTDYGRNLMLAALLGRAPISDDRLAVLESFALSFRDIIDEKKREIIAQLPHRMSQTKPAEPIAQRPTPSPILVTTTPSSDKLSVSLVTSLAHLVQAAIPLAEIVNSDKCSPEDRKKLRDLAGGNGVFRLANLLNRLCGEKARSQL